MKTINLRYCYPYYTGDVFVEVSDEVAEVMVQSVREMYNYDRRTRYHKAFYSLDAFDWTEKYALEHSPSAEEIILMKEEQAAYEKLLAMLDEAFSVITPMQARRVKGYYIRSRRGNRKEKTVSWRSFTRRSCQQGIPTPGMGR